MPQKIQKRIKINILDSLSTILICLSDRKKNITKKISEILIYGPEKILNGISNENGSTSVKIKNTVKKKAALFFKYII